MALNQDGVMTDGTFLSDMDRDLLIEKFIGDVDKQYTSASTIAGWISPKPVLNTDTISVRRFGNGDIKAVTPGELPNGDTIKTDKIVLTVDVHLYMREYYSKLMNLQTDINMEGETAMMHGRRFAQLYDESYFIQAVKGAQTTLTADQKLNGAFFDGIKEVLALANDELDPDALVDAMQTIVTKMKNNDIDLGAGFRWYLHPDQYKVVCDHPKLINSDYTEISNGDFAKRKVKVLDGIPLLESPRIPTAANASHILGASFNVTSNDALAVAVLFCPMSILAGESMPLAGDVWYDKNDKLWKVDSDRSYSLTVRNPGLCGAVFKSTYV